MSIATRRTVWGMTIACLVAAAARPQPAPSRQAYRISGVVVDSTNGRPLPQTRVFVAPGDGSSREMETTTGAGGQFAFEKLPAGAWTLSAERKGFFRQSYGQNAGAWGSSVVTGRDGVSENLTFRLDPPSAIKGKVMDEHGDPVPGAHLQLLVQIRAGRKRFLIGKTEATDDTGEYRLWGLPAVACYLFATVPLAAVGGPGEPSGFAPQYYQNTSDPRLASPIQLKPGEEFSADFVLRRARGVSVMLEGDSGIPGGNATELLVLLGQGPLGSEVSLSTLVPGQGRTFYNVPPGRHKLVIGDVRSTYATSKWIDAGSEDATVKLPFPDPPEVTAKVRVVDGDIGLLKNVTLRLHRFTDAGDNTRPLQPDGTARFPAMAAGRYMIILRPRQLYVKSVTGRNARIVDGQVELPETGAVHLEIVAGGDGARVKGRVRADGKPVAGALVVLAPRRESGNPDDYRGYQADSDGSFTFAGLQPGEYILFATNDWQLEYANPSAIGPYLGSGKPVKAEPNGSLEVQLELSRR